MFQVLIEGGCYNFFFPNTTKTKHGNMTLARLHVGSYSDKVSHSHHFPLKLSR